MITVPKVRIAEIERLLEALEQKGIEAEDAAARLNRALGEILSIAAERSRLAHQAHKILREIQGDTKPQ